MIPLALSLAARQRHATSTRVANSTPTRASCVTARAGTTLTKDDSFLKIQSDLMEATLIFILMLIVILSVNGTRLDCRVGQPQMVAETINPISRHDAIEAKTARPLPEIWLQSHSG